MNCPDCGTYYPEGAIFCTGCGRQLASVMSVDDGNEPLLSLDVAAMPTADDDRLPTELSQSSSAGAPSPSSTHGQPSPSGQYGSPSQTSQPPRSQAQQPSPSSGQPPAPSQSWRQTPGSAQPPASPFAQQPGPNSGQSQAPGGSLHRNGPNASGQHGAAGFAKMLAAEMSRSKGATRAGASTAKPKLHLLPILIMVVTLSICSVVVGFFIAAESVSSSVSTTDSTSSYTSTDDSSADDPSTDDPSADDPSVVSSGGFDGLSYEIPDGWESSSHDGSRSYDYYGDDSWGSILIWSVSGEDTGFDIERDFDWSLSYSEDDLDTEVVDSELSTIDDCPAYRIETVKSYDTFEVHEIEMEVLSPSGDLVQVYASCTAEDDELVDQIGEFADSLSFS